MVAEKKRRSRRQKTMMCSGEKTKAPGTEMMAAETKDAWTEMMVAEKNGRCRGGKGYAPDAERIALAAERMAAEAQRIVAEAQSIAPEKS